MNLLIHIGTEKTGSSYLQKLCGQNREFLLQRSIYFPGAGKDERRLMKGTISPGNARELAQLIHKSKWAEVSRWLHARVRAAENKRCDRLLLSHELLYAAMSIDKFFSKFVAAANQAGVKSVRALLMIRDPVDQAISLFKHRAKNGTVQCINQWIRKEYTLPEEIRVFLDQVDDSAIHLDLRKYETNTETIVGVFFRDWLGLHSSPPDSIEAVVNPSLTFSELQVIRHLAMTRPASVPLLYDRLLAIPRERKASDDHLERLARVAVANHLCRFKTIWEELAVRLMEDGGIDVPVWQAKRTMLANSYRFTNAQLLALTESHNEAMTVRCQSRLLLNRFLRRPIGRIRAKAEAFLTGRRG